jgi:hypothetical protein
MKGLMQHYGSYDKLPHTITARVLELEDLPIDAVCVKPVSYSQFRTKVTCWHFVVWIQGNKKALQIFEPLAHIFANTIL